MAYPIVLLTSWLLHCLLHKVLVLSSTCDAVAGKDLIHKGRRELEYAPIVRIFQLLKKTNSNELTAVLNDSTHKMLAVFRRECIGEFEKKYSRRITKNTVHTLIHITRANLRFATLKQEIVEMFGLSKQLEAITRLADIVYLEILDIEIFTWEQLKVDGYHEQALSLVYENEEYQHKYGKKSAATYLDGLVLNGMDGMLCDEQDLPQNFALLH